MTVSNGDLLRVVVNYDLPSTQLAQNVFSFLYAGNDSTPDATVLADFGVWGTSMALLWAGVSSGNAIFDFIAVSKLVGVSLELLGEVAISQVGVGSGEMLPHIDASLARVRLEGGKGQARKFWPGMTEPQQSESIIGAPALAVYAQLAASYFAIANSANFPGLSEIYIPGTFNQATGSFRNFIGAGAFISNIIGPLGRRKVGRGA